MTSPDQAPYLVAAVQAAPVFLDRDATLDKACRLIAEAGAAGAKLAVFPECFVPGYPFWVWFIPAGDTHPLRDLYGELLENAVDVPGPATERLCAAARDAGVAVAMGVNERNRDASGTTLFNTLVYIGRDGTLLGKHRKLVPTSGERLVHGMGDGSTLDVVDLGFARLGGLICWEHYMPLARQAMWAHGAQIHAAPTWDRGEPWLSTLRHTAKEGRVYVIGCGSAVHRDDIPDRLDLKEKYLPPGVEWVNPGGSAIVDPDGKYVVEPVIGQETTLYGEIDPKQLRGPRFQLDVAGHYARPDIFQLIVDRRPRPQIQDLVDAGEHAKGEERQVVDVPEHQAATPA